MRNLSNSAEYEGEGCHVVQDMWFGGQFLSSHELIFVTISLLSPLLSRRLAVRDWGSVISTREGGLLSLTPVSQPYFRALNQLQNILEKMIPPRAGMRAPRYCNIHSIRVFSSGGGILACLNLYFRDYG